MAGALCVLQAPVSLSPLSLYLHVGPDLSLAPRTVWDETLASQGRGAGVAPVERMEPNYRPVCHYFSSMAYSFWLLAFYTESLALTPYPIPTQTLS